MTEDDRFVYITEPLEDDDCHLVNCREDERRIRGLVAVVTYKNRSVIMHPECAQAFKKEVDQEISHKLSRVNAQWN